MPRHRDILSDNARAFIGKSSSEAKCLLAKRWESIAASGNKRVRDFLLQLEPKAILIWDPEVSLPTEDIEPPDYSWEDAEGRAIFEEWHRGFENRLSERVNEVAGMPTAKKNESLECALLFANSNGDRCVRITLFDGGIDSEVEKYFPLKQYKVVYEFFQNFLASI